MENNLPTFDYSNAITALINRCQYGTMSVSDLEWVRVALIQDNFFFMEEERGFLAAILQAVNTAQTEIDNDE